MDTTDVIAAREETLRAALRVLQAERGREDDPHYGDSLDLAEENLATAARDLTAATEAMPRSDRPIGWNDKPRAGRLDVSLSRDDLDLLIDALGRAESTRHGVDLLERLTQERHAFDRWGDDAENAASDDKPKKKKKGGITRALDVLGDVVDTVLP